jgi:hypothetical protein
MLLQLRPLALAAAVSLAPFGCADNGVTHVASDASADGAHGSDVTEGTRDTATEPAGRLFVAPDPAHFGEVGSGESKIVEVVLQNIGAGLLRIDSFTVQTDSGNFRVVDTGVSWAVLHAAGAFDDPQTTAVEADYITLLVGFTSVSAAPDRATLEIRSDDPESPKWIVELIANPD